MSISFRLDDDAMDSEEISKGGLISSIANSLGATLANVDNAELKLKGVML